MSDLGKDEQPEETDKSSFDKAFAEIANNQSDDSPELESIWDGIRVLWPHFFSGVMVKGFAVIEFLDDDGDRALQVIESTGLTTWDSMGIVQFYNAGLKEEARGAFYQSISQEMDDEDEEE